MKTRDGLTLYGVAYHDNSVFYFLTTKNFEFIFERGGVNNPDAKRLDCIQYYNRHVSTPLLGVLNHLLILGG
jgi:hypothetical protein